MINNPAPIAAFNEADAKTQLKKIGDQIEAFAKKWEAQSSEADCEGLYELGKRVEHFLDNLDDDIANKGSHAFAANPLTKKNAADQKDKFS